LFVPSGVMANQIALRVLTTPGTAVVAGRRQHVVAYEYGAAALNAGVQFVAVDDGDGTIDADAVRRARQATAHHQPAVSLVCVENTHMAASGAPWSMDRLQAVVDAAGSVPIHMDGARLFNAEAASGVAAAEWAASATTVMCCLSKGLGAPVGSLLAGPSDLIEDAKLHRKRFGGTMRQSGVIAAAGLVGLRRIERMVDDHRRARLLADAVAERWPDIGFDPATVETNIVTFSPPDAPGLIDYLGSEGVLAGTVAPGRVRLVTHADIDDAGVELARGLLAKGP
jgi:threonine aldolase